MLNRIQSLSKLSRCCIISVTAKLISYSPFINLFAIEFIIDVGLIPSKNELLVAFNQANFLLSFSISDIIIFILLLNSKERYSIYTIDSKKIHAKNLYVVDS